MGELRKFQNILVAPLGPHLVDCTANTAPTALLLGGAGGAGCCGAGLGLGLALHRLLKSLRRAGWE